MYFITGWFSFLSSVFCLRTWNSPYSPSEFYMYVMFDSVTAPVPQLQESFLQNWHQCFHTQCILGGANFITQPTRGVLQPRQQHHYRVLISKEEKIPGFSLSVTCSDSYAASCLILLQTGSGRWVPHEQVHVESWRASKYPRYLTVVCKCVKRMPIVAQRDTFCQRDWGSVVVGLNVELDQFQVHLHSATSRPTYRTGSS